MYVTAPYNGTISTMFDIPDDVAGKDYFDEIGQGITPTNQDIKVCTFHHAEMRRREKDGRCWYSHQLEDGSWCWGRSQEKEEGSHA